MSCIKQLLDTKKREPPLSDSHSEAVRSALYCWTNNSIAHADMIYSNIYAFRIPHDYGHDIMSGHNNGFIESTKRYNHTHGHLPLPCSRQYSYLEISHVSECTLNLTFVNAFNMSELLSHPTPLCTVRSIQRHYTLHGVSCLSLY